MKRSVIVLLVAALAAPVPLLAAEARIGVVNTAKLMRESPQSKTASDELNAEFAVRERELNGLQQTLTARQEMYQKDGATMTEMQRTVMEKDLRDRTRDLNSRKEALQEDYDARRTEVMQRLGNELTLAIQAYGKAQGFDLILADGVVWASAAYDVTLPVLEDLKKKAGVSAAAPAATPAKPPAAKPPATTPAKP